MISLRLWGLQDSQSTLLSCLGHRQMEIRPSETDHWKPDMLLRLGVCKRHPSWKPGSSPVQNILTGFGHCCFHRPSLVFVTRQSLLVPATGMPMDRPQGFVSKRSAVTPTTCHPVLDSSSWCPSSQTLSRFRSVPSATTRHSSTWEHAPRTSTPGLHLLNREAQHLTCTALS